MGAVRPLLAGILLAAPLPASAQSVATWRPFVEEAALRYGVPTSWIERVMNIESRGKTRLGGRPIVSSAGAMGLMQLMPRTWRELRALAALGNDPFDPHDNIAAGALYLRLLYDRFGYPGLFAAYNAGPGRYGSFLAGRRALPLETLRYLSATTGDLASGSGRLASGNGVFSIRPKQALPLASSTTLFAIRTVE
jgi:soluble lytic murein transglycosylase-like protein